MDVIWQELTAGFTDQETTIRILTRLLAAMALGAVVGIQRERAGKPAGLRTHMLVAMGTALVVIVCTSGGMDSDGLSRVIQGIVTGIGFIGTGAILKQSEKLEVHGLTTAAGLWMTAAVGVGVGLGRIGISIVSVIFIYVTLSIFGMIEKSVETRAALNKKHLEDNAE